MSLVNYRILFVLNQLCIKNFAIVILKVRIIYRFIILVMRKKCNNLIITTL
ncbi:MAG: hypothetical protein SO067_01280 [Bacilli bacterium]|jgi:hypothetical protein|nr:hypothetical protein [Bacilli bacterium]